MTSIEVTNGLPPVLSNNIEFPNITMAGVNIESYYFSVEVGASTCEVVNKDNKRFIEEPFDINLGADAADGDYTLCIWGEGEFAQVSSPVIHEFERVLEYVNGYPDVESYTTQISGASTIKVEDQPDSLNRLSIEVPS